MHKKRPMKNVLKHATLCIAVACFVFGSLLSMDGAEDKGIGLLLDNGLIIASLLKERLDYFDHYALCSLAVNKEWDELLKKTAPQRKRDLMMQVQGQSGHKVLKSFWHRYGSACAKVISEADKPQPLLELICFGYQHCLRIGWMEKNYQICISNFVRPRFDENGIFCFYILEEADRNGRNQFHLYRAGNYYRQIVEHSCAVGTYASRSFPSYSAPMYIHNSRSINLLIHKDQFGESCVNLIDFLSFPVFLNVCINALVECDDNCGKVCDLQKVHLPDDYKKCVPHGQSQYKSYGELPEFWREMINTRYREQQKK